MGQPVQVATPEQPAAAPPEQSAGQPTDTPTQDAIQHVAIDRIGPNPHQPRQQFDGRALEQLAASIRQDGIMQPVILRPAPGDDDRYELVAGERRWRAAELAELDAVPAIVRPLTNLQLAEWALVENLQREDLNPIEKAKAFAGLSDRHGMSHEQIADRVGVERSTVTNFIRLLGLDGTVQDMVRESLISLGHAKVLLGVTEPARQRSLATQAARQQWSVRQLESAVKAGDSSTASTSTRKAAPHLADLEKQIGSQLNTRVKLKQSRKKGAGSLTIDFYSVDEFDALLEKLGVEVDS